MIKMSSKRKVDTLGDDTLPLILLLGMVYAKYEKVQPSYGQEFRDLTRINGLISLGYKVHTLDNKHSEDRAVENMHCESSFLISESKLSTNLLKCWGDHKYDLIILDYFFSPVGFINL